MVVHLDHALTPHGAVDMRSIRTKITLRHSKGSKKSNDNIVKHFKTLKKAYHMDPTILLLTHALRHGLVNGDTLSDVLEHATTQSGQQLVWTRPDAPVLPAFAATGAILLDKPASAEQLCASTKQIGLVSGVMERRYSHALRLGYAKEVAQMGDLPGAVTNAVRQALGHGSGTSRAVTEGYMGEITAAIHSIREENAEAGLFLGQEATFTSASLVAAARDHVSQQDLQAYLDFRVSSARGPFARKNARR